MLDGVYFDPYYTDGANLTLASMVMLPLTSKYQQIASRYVEKYDLSKTS